MAIERKWETIDALAFTADGTEGGIVTVSDTKCFKVKMNVILAADGLGEARYEVKRVLSSTQMVLGPENSKISTRSDLSAYTVLLNATISAPEQDKANVPPEDFERAVYEHEPTVAKRAFLVDKYGDGYDDSNPLPTSAQINVGSLNLSVPEPNTRSLSVVTAADLNEIVFDLPNNTKRYRIFIRDNTGGFRLAFVAGGTNVSTAYTKIRRGNYWESPKLDLPDNSKVYLKAEKVGTIFQIISYQLN